MKKTAHPYDIYVFEITETESGGVTVGDYNGDTVYGEIPNTKIPDTTGTPLDVLDLEHAEFERKVNDFIEESILTDWHSKSDF